MWRPLTRRQEPTSAGADSGQCAFRRWRDAGVVQMPPRLGPEPVRGTHVRAWYLEHVCLLNSKKVQVLILWWSRETGDNQTFMKHR